ncbi:Legume lectin domain [Dillenia turbinata]|uniref:non-specific serine/threonine protein kinase n=1 Tax=Dillenia turbinata TaxID=194707 RepID=A0AAN8WDA7_9MAGN
MIQNTNQLSFNISSFTPNELDNMNYTGQAYVTGEGIQLTPIELNHTLYFQAGRATFRDPMQLWDNTTGNLTDFNTHFSFVIKSIDGQSYADGIAFFMAPFGSGIPSDTAGESLGLAKETELLNSTYHFVAVEFDTYMNSWDPPKDHVGIDVNSMKSVANTTWFSSIFAGRTNDAWISYNSTTKNLSVTFTGFKNNNTIEQQLSYVIDLRLYLPELVTFGFTSATGSLYEINNIKSWEFSSSLQVDSVSVPPKKGKNNKIVPSVISGGLVLCVLIAGVILFLLWKKKKVEVGNDPTGEKSMGGELEFGRGAIRFSFQDLYRATNGFVDKLGQGGFGQVYKGSLENTFIAVKRISKDSSQGIKEFISEVKIISQLHHKNLVKLIGWCHEKKEFLLVYELMPKGSLDKHLYNHNNLLRWPTRFKIAKGLASALFYLHEECEQCILHRDIKSSNVMLDTNFNAKLGDFGLARLVDHDKGSQTTMPAGTIGYMAPECVIAAKAGKESDVYSFGIVALELACGRKPFIPTSEASQVIIVDWVWELYERGRLFEAADPRIYGDHDGEQMEEMQRLLIIGLWCAHPDPNCRPLIRKVIQVLNFEDQVPILPERMTPIAPLVSAISH